MRCLRFLVLLSLVAAMAAAAPPFVPRPGAPFVPAAPTATATNRPAGGVGFGTKRLASTSAEEASIRELFHCAVRLLPDDRTELTYDFSYANQLEDFAPKPGNNAPTFVNGPWEVRDGFLQKLVTQDAPIFHRARFTGPVTVSFKGFLIKGSQYAAGFLDTKNNGQLLAGVGGSPLTMFLAENAKEVANATKTPLTGKVQELMVNFDAAAFSIASTGLTPLLAPRRVASLGQAFFAAPESAAALDDLRITGQLDLLWFRETIDARLTKANAGRIGPRYGPPPATESQLRQMIKGFQKLMGDGKIVLHYDFTDPAQFSDWQVFDPRGRADPFAWRVYDGVVHKSQFGPTFMMLQPLLVGPMKISSRGAIISGQEASMGLRDVDAAVQCGFGLGLTGFFLGEDGAKRQTAQLTGVLLNQLHELAMTRDDAAVTARIDAASPLASTTKRAEPFNVVLAANESTAIFDDVHVEAFLDYDWCVRQLKLHGYQQASLPGAFNMAQKKPADPGKLAQSVAFSSSSKMKVQANADWQDTRIMLRKGDTVNFIASGSFQYERSAKATSGPEGQPGATTKNRPPCPKLTPCALVGRIGFGEPFEIGAEKQVVSQELGQLSLRINEQPLYDNSGALDVEIVVIPVAK